MTATLSRHDYKRQAKKDAKPPRRNEERDLQRAVIQHVMLIGAPDIIFWHTPNGMVSNPVTVNRMKDIGLVPGVPDLCFIRGNITIFLELKSKRGSLTPDQEAFRLRCKLNMVPWACCDNIDDALEFLRQWGMLRHDSFRKLSVSRKPLLQAAE